MKPSSSPQLTGSAAGAGNVQGTPSSAASLIFRRKTERLDWRQIASIDIHSLLHTTSEDDLKSLLVSQLLPQIAYCSIEDELSDPQHEKLHPGFVKVFQIAQLLIEFLLHQHHVAFGASERLEATCAKLVQEKEEQTKMVGTLKEALAATRKELRARKEVGYTQNEAEIKDEYDKCPYCSKKFISTVYLVSHLQRRHQGLPFPPLLPRPNTVGVGAGAALIAAHLQQQYPYAPFQSGFPYPSPYLDPNGNPIPFSAKPQPPVNAKQVVTATTSTQTDIEIETPAVEADAESGSASGGPRGICFRFQEDRRQAWARELGAGLGVGVEVSTLQELRQSPAAVAALEEAEELIARMKRGMDARWAQLTARIQETGIEELKQVFVDEMHKMKDMISSSVGEQNQSLGEIDVHLISTSMGELEERFRKQELELEALRNIMQARMEEDTTAFESKLQAQEEFWRRKLVEVQNQFEEQATKLREEIQATVGAGGRGGVVQDVKMTSYKWNTISDLQHTNQSQRESEEKSTPVSNAPPPDSEYDEESQPEGEESTAAGVELDTHTETEDLSPVPVQTSTPKKPPAKVVQVQASPMMVRAPIPKPRPRTPQIVPRRRSPISNPTTPIHAHAQRRVAGTSRFTGLEAGTVINHEYEEPDSHRLHPQSQHQNRQDRQAVHYHKELVHDYVTTEDEESDSKPSEEDQSEGEEEDALENDWDDGQGLANDYDDEGRPTSALSVEPHRRPSDAERRAAELMEKEAKEAQMREVWNEVSRRMKRLGWDTGEDGNGNGNGTPSAKVVTKALVEMKAWRSRSRGGSESVSQSSQALRVESEVEVGPFGADHKDQGQYEQLQVVQSTSRTQASSDPPHQYQYPHPHPYPYSNFMATPAPEPVDSRSRSPTQHQFQAPDNQLRISSSKPVPLRLTQIVRLSPSMSTPVKLDTASPTTSATAAEATNSPLVKMFHAVKKKGVGWKNKVVTSFKRKRSPNENAKPPKKSLLARTKAKFGRKGSGRHGRKRKSSSSPDSRAAPAESTESVRQRRLRQDLQPSDTEEDEEGIEGGEEDEDEIRPVPLPLAIASPTRPEFSQYSRPKRVQAPAPATPSTSAVSVAGTTTAKTVRSQSSTLFRPVIASTSTSVPVNVHLAPEPPQPQMIPGPGGLGMHPSEGTVPESGSTWHSTRSPSSPTSSHRQSSSGSGGESSESSEATRKSEQIRQLAKSLSDRKNNPETKTTTAVTPVVTATVQEPVAGPAPKSAPAAPNQGQGQSQGQGRYQKHKAPSATTTASKKVPPKVKSPGKVKRNLLADFSGAERRWEERKGRIYSKFQVPGKEEGDGMEMDSDEAEVNVDKDKDKKSESIRDTSHKREENREEHDTSKAGGTGGSGWNSPPSEDNSWSERAI